MSKAIVICADGTWNDPGQKVRGVYRPSNVVKIAAAIPAAGKDDRGNDRPQLVFYDAGIGTGGPIDRLIAGATGMGLSRNVKDCYSFLINNYEPGDAVYLFGFSRGAYTVRSLAGLIGKCHLPRKEHWQRYNRAYELYSRKRLGPNSRAIVNFRNRFTQPCPIKFIGVWDTVGGLGLPLSGLRTWLLRKYTFHNTNLSPDISHAYHAVAIDEHRKKFKPTLWKTANVSPDQTVEQVWFAGAHSDVGGGGYRDAGLAGVAFMWMKDKAEAAGLAFDAEYIREHIRANIRGIVHDSRTGIFGFRSGMDREIGTGQYANESIHESVLERLEEMGRRYSPATLVEARERGVPPFPPPVELDEAAD